MPLKAPSKNENKAIFSVGFLNYDTIIIYKVSDAIEAIGIC
jgi:hypothetical protein